MFKIGTGGLETPGRPESRDRNKRRSETLEKDSLKSGKDQGLVDTTKGNRSDIANIEERLRDTSSKKPATTLNIPGSEMLSGKESNTRIYNPEQTMRILGVNTAGEVAVFGSPVLLKTGAKLYIEKDGTSRVSGYTQDGSDVKKIHEWFDEGLKDFVDHLDNPLAA